ncbi:MAG: hypothetical protein EAZ70_13545 [Runella slithyformis]|jgi:hypothetical protein|nr:MAG: hypothetical protein EAY79_00190 [Runella slithyformis]TAG20003.1 MAG: hypothetical protein EAZ38_11190 [Cytophagales bacterium]TAG43080.1 MAG: hypothetical protein EAZ32_00260 [Cytophagia bacterium]TAF22919.1 MAG: hypothetical protein EAZ70_13545 [Runella slithyformis]TAF49180.1 MAG: hypothetical protein EAZ63_02045 [Runella slithyformis]
MPVYKSQNADDISKYQREYWHSKTPQERLDAALKLMEQAKAIYAANPKNPPLDYGTSILKSRTPIERRKR